LKINWNYIKFSALVILVVFLFAFSSERNSNRKLQGKDVVFVEDDNHFITIDMVNKLLIQNNVKVTSIGKEALDLNEMEQRLNNNPMISKAEVYVTIDGILGAKVKQRKPIARVNAATPFYIDEDGKEMPLSREHAARVPLISGIAIKDYSHLKDLLLKIKADSFMKNHVVGIQIENKEELILHLRVYDFKILFGKAENIDKKFQNFKAFYQKTIIDSSLYAYSLVNLKLDSQVVATKN